MKQKKFLIVALAFAMMTLCGCCMKHEWIPATCQAPETCAVCGKTRGEVGDHTWLDADCECPKTCSVCGLTEGSALGHTWKEADCENPKACTVCGKIDGEALGHDWVMATFETPKTCKTCGKTEGDVLTCTEIKMKDYVEGYYDRVGLVGDTVYSLVNQEPNLYFDFYGLDGTKKGSYCFETSGGGWCWALNDASAVFSTDWEETFEIVLVDFNGNEMFRKEFSLYDYYIDFSDYYPSTTYANTKGVIRVYLKGSGETLFCYDTVNKCEVSEEEYENGKTQTPEYDESKWAYYSEDTNINGVLVETADEKQWGFLDSDGNELAMFKDATKFNNSGYALVSNDRVHYTVIDKYFNVVASDYFEAMAATYSSRANADLFKCTGADGEERYYLIK